MENALAFSSPVGASTKETNINIKHQRSSHGGGIYWLHALALRARTEGRRALEAEAHAQTRDCIKRTSCLRLLARHRRLVRICGGSFNGRW